MSRSLSFGVTPGKYPKKGQTAAVDVAQVALWNEYGTETIPPRPAFREGLDHAMNVNRKLIDAQLRNVTQRILTGRQADFNKSLTVLLTQIGKSAKAKTKELIKSGSMAPANAPRTIEKKGFDHPLFETGLLLESVDYEVSR